MSYNFFSTKKRKSFYRDCFTIDPRRGAVAWEKLNTNEWGLEIGMLPKTLHHALLETLMERKTLEHREPKQSEKIG